MHAPCAVDELQLPVSDQCFGHIAPIIRLLIPPAGEEPSFDVNEMTFRILDELIHDGVNNIVNFGEKVPAHRALRVNIVPLAEPRVSAGDEVAAVQRGSGGGADGLTDQPSPASRCHRGCAERGAR